MGNKKVFVAGLIVMAFLAANLSGQSMSAKIVGTVKNEEGTRLSGVTVSAINIGNNSEATCSSDKGGSFRLLGLHKGNYQVSFDRQGYQSYVVAGIALSVEQSITLHITLKKDEPSTGKQTMLSTDKMTIPLTETDTIAADPATESQLERLEKMKSFAGGRLSFSMSYSMNYMAVGDTNTFLRAYSSHAAGRLRDSFATLHEGNDRNIEISYRVSSRLEIGLGLGLVQGHLRKSYPIIHPYLYPNAGNEGYSTNLNIKAVPLQAICRYGLGHGRFCFYSIYGAILYNFATWNLESHYWKQRYLPGYDKLESASGRGLGIMAGGRAEVVLENILALTIDLSGRYAPLRNFSGRREYREPNTYGAPQISRGKLWFFEYYDQARNKWVWDLGIGDRPAGPETRNVTSAKVDFSGLALRFGAMFKF